MISAEIVKELREKTGAGMMDCKKVLTETNGDMEKSMELLRERGIAKAAVKASRIASEGLVLTYIADDNKVGSVVEVNSETDFMAKTDDFKKFVEMIAFEVATQNPKDVADLLEKKTPNGKTIQELLTETIATTGENTSIRRIERFERIETDGLVESYVHGNGKIGVLVELTKPEIELAKDICMQIAAARPEYVDRTQVPAEVLQKEMDILKAQAINEGKPEQIAEKIVAGRIEKYYSEICLVDQPFVKNPDVTIKSLLAEKQTEVKRFVRFEKGEGLQKREENFAEEVAKRFDI